MHPLELEVLGFIGKHNLLGGATRVVAAVSGGADSVALLLILASLRASLQLELCAAHLNHRLRGLESDGDEDFVTRLCRSMDLPLRISHWESRDVDRSGNLEDAARKARYDFLARCALEWGGCVATGHNLNDQAETLLLKLFRGAGPSGLSGIFPARFHCINDSQGPRRVRVARPLLALTREEILEYLSARGADWRQDSSNLNLDFDRNWVRNWLLPALEQRLNCRVVENLGRSAALFRQVEAYLEQEAEKVLGGLLTSEADEAWLPVPELNEIPEIIRKQALRAAIRRLKGDLEDIHLAHMDSILRLCNGPSGRSLDLPGGLRVSREFDRLRITLGFRETPTFSYDVEVPGEVAVEEVRKRVHVVPASTGVREDPSPGLRPHRLQVRNRRPGDRFRMHPKAPSKKTKELFRAKRVPRSERDRLIVIQFGATIVWVEGLGFNADITKDGLRQPPFDVVIETF